MRRALELAQRGIGSVSPNPLVGCVIVVDGNIIGEGWHKKFGEAHAEVNAINTVSDPALLSKSTVYVTLEPCSHTGKTPPCADLLIAKKVKKVVIATVDTNPLVAGQGIGKLRAAGIDVQTGVLDQEARELNRRFFLAMEKQRPYLILKWAETADGFLARENHDSRWISNEYSRQLVHKWRTEEDAVLVGRNTVSHDDPQLNVRDWSGRNPVRVAIDRFLKAPEKRKIFDGSQPTLVYNVLKNEERRNLTLVRIEEQAFLWHLVRDLHKRGIQSVIIEGGAETLRHFIDQGLWDEARVFKSSRTFNAGIESPRLRGNLIGTENVMGDTLFIWRNTPGNDHR